MKKLLSMLAVFALLLVGCGTVSPTEPTATTTPEPTTESTSATTVPQLTFPTEEKWVWEEITPENGVLILSGNEIIKDTIIKGDVYITSTGKVTFDRVIVERTPESRGNVYCYGQLNLTGGSVPQKIYAYAFGRYTSGGGMLVGQSCEAFDDEHGFIGGTVRGELIISDDALDYAFEKWGKQ